MSKIILTGATGFIGKHLLPQLIFNGHECIAVDRSNGDIAEEETWQSFPKADVVIHLAAKSFVPDSWVFPEAFVYSNVIGTISALNYCRKNNAALVFLSSYLYGNPKRMPIRESDAIEATNPYALSKKLAEETCKFYSESFHLDVTIIRPFNVYGSGQPGNFLIPLIIRQIESGNIIEVKDLEPKRDYIYIKDLTSAISKSVDTIGGFNVLNIGSGISHSVKELIDIIQDIKNTNLEVSSEYARRKDEIMDTVADIRLAKKTLNWSPKWSMKEGLIDMIECND